jgi:hypothetical protein
MKEVIEKYKKGDSDKKLSMISDLVTIVVAIPFAVVVQVLTLLIAIDEYTFMSIALYMGGFSFSCLAIFLILKIRKVMAEHFDSFWLYISVVSASGAIFLWLTSSLWSFILKI